MKYLRHRLLRLRASPYAIAVGFSCGVATSFTPLVGFHFLIAALFCFPLRGNILAAALGTLIGNPLTFPFMWGLSYKLGMFLLGHPVAFAHEGLLPPGGLGAHLSFDNILVNIWDVALPWMLGSLITGPVAALVAFGVVSTGVRAFRASKLKQKELLQQLKEAKARKAAAAGEPPPVEAMMAEAAAMEDPGDMGEPEIGSGNMRSAS